MDRDVKSRSDWQDLLQLAQGHAMVIERISIPGKHVAVEGAYELPELARLSLEDQVFVVAFLRSHGSIKEMEQIFGVSYPTIKARLNRVAGSLKFIDTDVDPPISESKAEVLTRLSNGEISADDAVRALEAIS